MEEFKFDFENLKVYQKSLDFIDEVFFVYKELNTEYKYSIGNNLIRAGLSIANNIAEGNGKKSAKEKKRYFDISSDSTRECVSVFNVLKRQKLIDGEDYVKLRQGAREITSMLRGLIDSL
jgi:four helix bundle protein